MMITTYIKNDTLKSFVKMFYEWKKQRKNFKRIQKWEKKGKPAPPPHIIKIKTLLHYSKLYDLKIFVETGTLYGDTLQELKNDFERLYSIELSEVLFKRAEERFKDETKIKLIQGDSGVKLIEIIGELNQSALFWLDGHFSSGETAKGDKDTPIIQELDIVLKHNFNHVIIIDDARCFGTDPAYPTLQYLKNYIKSIKPKVDICIGNDSIRIVPLAYW